MRVLVDGDILVYRAAFATEYPKYSVEYGLDYVEEFQYKKDAVSRVSELEESHPEAVLKTATILEPVQNALHIVDSMLGDISYHFGVPRHTLEVVLTGAYNFREKVAVTQKYKGNRQKPKPVHYPDVREYLRAKHGAHVVDGEEADDWLGYTHYAAWEDDLDGSVIVTIDKDLDMIPGRHYNFVKKEEYYVDEEDADRAFLGQLLTGDTSDHIPGIQGIGAVGAAAMSEDKTVSEFFDAVRNTYYARHGEDANTYLDEQAKLLWIRRRPEQDWKDYWEVDNERPCMVEPSGEAAADCAG